MSKLFFDHLLDLKEIDKEIKKVAKTTEERDEMRQLVDEMIHHKVMGCIFDNLPRDNHNEFLDIFHKTPYDTETIFAYLKGKIGQNIEELLKQEIGTFSTDLLREIKSQ